MKELRREVVGANNFWGPLELETAESGKSINRQYLNIHSFIYVAQWQQTKWPLKWSNFPSRQFP
jgi:hypothetical protein